MNAPSDSVETPRAAVLTATTVWNNTGIPAPASFRRQDFRAVSFRHFGSDGWSLWLIGRDGRDFRIQADTAEVARVVAWFTGGRPVSVPELTHRALRDEQARLDADRGLYVPLDHPRRAEVAYLLTLVPETETGGCRCGNACPFCANCMALATGCRWDRCCQGLVDPVGGYAAQLAAIDAVDRRARLRRSRRAA
jgi:hypothetical protein